MHLRENTILQGGKYRIKRFISSGGFGCTYEAESVTSGKRVAIKEFFVKDFCNRDENTQHVTVGTQSKKGLVDKLQKKFIDEARVLQEMHHPSIVSVSEVFEENGTAYFVMDYIDGPSLHEIVKKEGALDEKRAVRYVRQAAEALQYVHNRNRLHLDIKPHNIMINSNDQAILIDFGASKQYDEMNGENTSTLIGQTPGYAPLEQIGNDVVKFFPATDIYSLGATLYKLLSGETPLSASLLASGEELEPLPNSISVATRKAIDEAMRINKNKRTQSVAEFLTNLGTVSEASTSAKKKRTKKEPVKETGEETLVIQDTIKKTNASQQINTKKSPQSYQNKKEYPMPKTWIKESIWAMIVLYLLCVIPATIVELDLFLLSQMWALFPVIFGLVGIFMGIQVKNKYLEGLYEMALDLSKRNKAVFVVNIITGIIFAWFNIAIWAPEILGL